MLFPLDTIMFTYHSPALHHAISVSCMIQVAPQSHSAEDNLQRARMGPASRAWDTDASFLPESAGAGPNGAILPSGSSAVTACVPTVEWVAKVTHAPDALVHAPVEVRDDKEVVLAAMQSAARWPDLRKVGKGHKTFACVSEQLRGDREVVLVALDTCRLDDGLLLPGASARLLQEVTAPLTPNDPELMRAVTGPHGPPPTGESEGGGRRDAPPGAGVPSGGAMWTPFWPTRPPEALTARRRAHWVATVAADPDALIRAPAEVRDDGDVVVAALGAVAGLPDAQKVCCAFRCFRSASDRLRGDREVVLRALEACRLRNGAMPPALSAHLLRGVAAPLSAQDPELREAAQLAGETLSEGGEMPQRHRKLSCSSVISV